MQQEAVGAQSSAKNPIKGIESLSQNSDFLIPISLQSNFIDVRYFKLWILLDKIA